MTCTVHQTGATNIDEKRAMDVETDFSDNAVLLLVLYLFTIDQRPCQILI